VPVFCPSIGVVGIGFTATPATACARVMVLIFFFKEVEFIFFDDE
jgi:hypothetical protein